MYCAWRSPWRAAMSPWPNRAGSPPSPVHSGAVCWVCLTPSGRSRTAGTAPRRWAGAVSGGSGWPATCAPATTRAVSRAPSRCCTRSPPGVPKRVSPPAWRRRWRAATSKGLFACCPPARGSSPADSTTCCGCASMRPPASAWSPSSPGSRPRSPCRSWCACGSTSPPPDRTPCRGGSSPSRRPRAPRRRSSPPPADPVPPTRRWFAPSRKPYGSGSAWGGSPSTKGCTRATRLRWDCAQPHRVCARPGAAPVCPCPRARRSASSCTGATCRRPLPRPWGLPDLLQPRTGTPAWTWTCRPSSSPRTSRAPSRSPTTTCARRRPCTPATSPQRPMGRPSSSTSPWPRRCGRNGAMSS